MLKLKQLLCSIMLLFCLCSYQGVWAQESGRVSIPAGQITLQNLIRQIEKQTDYSFVFDSSINLEQTLTLKSTSGKDVQMVLKQALSQSGIIFKVAGSQIILKVAPTGKEKKDISGVITDENGEPVIGATVRLKGSGSGTITNMDGQFALTASAGEELEISYVGCITQNIKIGDNNSFKVVLKEDAQNLEEVVVVGYGTQKKKDLTSAIATIGGKELSSQTVSNAVAAMQGRLSGVQVTNSGSPGSSPSIRIRGTGSVFNVNPIYVVDGMIVDDISYLGPNDIESMSVLKDASASAIYGVRAANGVIMVTTKRGAKEGKIKVDFNAYVGVKTPSHVHELINGPEYITLYNEFMEYSGNESAKLDPNKFTSANNTDWFDEILTSTFTSNEDITIRGGNDRSTFSVGINHLKEDGLVKNNNYERLGLRANYDFKINKNITTGLNFVVTSSKTNPYDSSSLTDCFVSTPLLPTSENNGGQLANPNNINGYDIGYGNPEAKLYYNHQWQNAVKAVINGFIDIKLFKNFTFHSTLGLNPTYVKGISYTPKYDVGSNIKNPYNKLSKSISDSNSLSWDNTLTYEKVFAQNHSLKVMLGYSYRESNTNSLSGSAEDIIDIPEINQSYLFLTIGKGTNYTMRTSDGGSKIVQIGYLGRINYDYKHRYLLNATLRADASSKFPANNRRGYFPSLGLGWVISEEPFMQDSGIDFMKLRVSWGQLGNDNIPSNLYKLTTSNVGSIIWGSEQNSGTGIVNKGVTINNMFNPNLEWEVVNETNIGLDINCFSNRFSTSLDWYYKLTDGAIFVPSFLNNSGLSNGSALGNYADILNTGIECNISWNDNIGNFAYRINANFSYNKSEIKKINLAGASYFEKGDNLTTISRTYLGHPIGEFFGYKAIGVFQNEEQIASTPHMSNTKPGTLIYEDVNKDGIIDANDRTSLGNPNPPFIYGFNLGGEYKNIDFNVFCQGVAGNKIFNSIRSQMWGVRMYDKDFYDNRWHGEGTSNEYPSVLISANDPRQLNSFFIESGNYFRIKAIQVGYSLPKNILSKLHMEKLRIYLNAENPFTFFGYNGFSPEVSSSDPLLSGVNLSTYPLSSVYSLGVNVTF